jgi:hypothetical protein
MYHHRLQLTNLLVQPDSIKTEEQVSAALNNLREAQDKCHVTHKLLKWKSTGNVPKDKAMCRIILAEGRNLVVIDGILCRIAPPHISAKRVPRIQTVVPISMRRLALQATHDALIGGGHFGMDKTY